MRIWNWGIILTINIKININKLKLTISINSSTNTNTKKKKNQKDSVFAWRSNSIHYRLKQHNDEFTVLKKINKLTIGDNIVFFFKIHQSLLNW